MTYKTEQEMREIEYVGKSFFGDLDVSLKNAKNFATKLSEGGYVASLPQLIEKRTELLQKGIPLRTLRERRITAFSEENVGVSSQGNPLFMIIHGGGILNNPKRIKNKDRVKRFDYSPEEWNNLLEGKLSDGTEIPLFTFREFVQKNDIPARYGVILDLKQEIERQNSRNEIYKIVNSNFYGRFPVEVFLDDPLFISRVGGIKQSYEFIYALKRDSEGKSFFNHFSEKIETDKPNGAFLTLGSIGGGHYHNEPDITYHNHSYNDAQCSGNFVGVAKKALDSLELIASKNEREKLVNEILESSVPFIPNLLWKDFETKLKEKCN